MILSLIALATQEPWVIAVIAYGFVARVLTGPTLSPLGQLVTKVITPRLGIAGSGLGTALTQLVLSVTAAVLAIGFGEQAAANVLLAALVAAATLESVFGYCLGCKIFALLMKAGIVPEEARPVVLTLRLRGASQLP